MTDENSDVDGTTGVAYPRFVKRPWPEVREFLGHHQPFRHLVDVIDSVVNSGVAERLAVTTSMHDLLVTLAPIAEPTLSIIIVRAPGSLARPRPGEVIVEHRAPDGRFRSGGDAHRAEAG